MSKYDLPELPVTLSIWHGLLFRPNNDQKKLLSYSAECNGHAEKVWGVEKPIVQSIRLIVDSFLFISSEMWRSKATTN
jgi:hypothetical protein